MSIKDIQNAILKNSPAILSGFGCAGVFTTAALAVGATPKALTLLDEKKKKNNGDDLSKRDIVKTTWTCYIPSFIVGAVTVACIIGSNTISNRRNTALSALYTLSETALREYQSKVVEEIGKTKATKIKDDVIADKFKKNPPSLENVIITGKGDTLCCDAFTGRCFRSDIEKIRQAANEIDKRLRNEMWVSLNDLYFELGIKEVPAGEDVGFDVEKGWVEMSFSSQLTENTVPCLVISYNLHPRYNS